MAYLTEEQLHNIGFKKLGKNIKISDKVSIYRPEEMEIGNNIRIDDFCIISGKITLGNNIHISVYSYIFGGNKGVIMEDFSGLAYSVKVFTDSDDYSGKSMTNPTVPEKFKPYKQSKAIHISKHSIVGANSLILPGVKLAEGTAVGAQSMVTKSTKEWGIYSGVPAKRIMNRKMNILELEKEYLNEFE